MDAIYPIIRHVHSFDSASLPATTVAITKRFILDAVAVMMAGSRAEGCDAVKAYIGNWNGKPDAAVTGGGRSPAPYAAMANSMMAHAVEFDDTYEPADVHAYAVVLPAVLAAAEINPGKAVTGRDIIAAAAIGVDISYRLGSAIKVYRGWQPTSTCGNLAGTLAAGRIAGCDSAELHNAAGIAYGLVAGNFQAVVDASLTKRLQPGFSARAAVEAVLLARAGITGARDILEGTFGFFPLYEAGEYDPIVLTDQLGSRFLGDAGSMKPYPCCRFCHAAIDAALIIVSERGVFSDPGEIREAEVTLPAETYDYIGKPYAADSPNPRVAAQFSVPYTVASALLRGKVGLAEFSLTAVKEDRVCQLARRICVNPVEASRYGPVTLRVTLQSGETVERTVKTMKGEPGNPLSDSELSEKVQACTDYGGFSGRTAGDLKDWVAHLEQDRNPLPKLHSILQARGVS